MLNDLLDAAFDTTAELGVSIALVLSLRATITPESRVGAADNVTVPVVAWPPNTVFGDRVRLTRLGDGMRVRFEVLVTVPRVAVIWRVALAPTCKVPISTAFEVVSCGTIVCGGVVIEPLLSDIFTVVPPRFALLSSVTVAVVGDPPWTDVGDTVRLVRLGFGRIVTVVCLEAKPRVALTTAVSALATTFVGMPTEVKVCPAGIVTDAGGRILEDGELSCI